MVKFTFFLKLDSQSTGEAKPMIAEWLVPFFFFATAWTLGGNLDRLVLTPLSPEALLFSALGSGFRVQGSVFRVQGTGFKVRGSEFRVQGSEFRVQVQVSGFGGPFALDSP